MINYELLADSTLPIVTLAEAKLHCKVDNDADDSLIANLITAAKKTCEKFTNRSLINQTWAASFDYVDFVKAKNYYLPFGKIQSITSVATYNQDNTQTIIAPDNYRTFGSRFIFNSTYTLPAYGDFRTDGAMQIVWVAGFGATADDVPQDIKQAALLLIRHWYENRGVVYSPLGKAEAETLPMNVVAILSNYRIYEL